MKTEIDQEKKQHLDKMEISLRLSGQQLDDLWMRARDARGQERINIHKQIAPLREKQRAGRIEQEALKKA